MLNFGTLEVGAYLTPFDYTAVRSRFQNGLRNLARRNSCDVKFLGVAEIGTSLMVHEHYAMASTAPVSKLAIKSLWDSAVGSFPTVVYHQPMRNVVGSARYIFKDKASHRPGGGAFVYLFARNTIDIRWGSKGFWRS